MCKMKGDAEAFNSARTLSVSRWGKIDKDFLSTRRGLP